MRLFVQRHADSAHPTFGFMHVRLQKWLPFNLHVCVNGREWLGRQMDAAGIGHLRKGNCFPWVADLPQAQALLDEQARHPYATTRGEVAASANPALKSIVGDYGIGDLHEEKRKTEGRVPLPRDRFPTRAVPFKSGRDRPHKANLRRFGCLHHGLKARVTGQRMRRASHADE